MSDLTKAELVKKLVFKDIEIRQLRLENQKLKSKTFTNVIKRFFRG